ncbi:MAG: hypothetical protein HYV95_07090 [Opitutae bacterium]|nr:hypothetical protein [Opitutae bacterium]
MAPEISSPASAPPATLNRWLVRAGVWAAVAFLWLRVSDNTVDNDLWGHVLYGQRMLQLRGLETTDALSWTAAGQPWINHEVLAEVALGLTHRLAGGTGLWLLMIGLATVTLGWAWREGAGNERPQRAAALALLALCGNFIALGYAVRPQLFTWLAFVALLVALRRFFSGRSAWGFAPPLLFALWVNTHGGYLAGWLITLLAVATEMLGARLPVLAQKLRCSAPSARTGAMLGIAAASSLCLLVNPWGWQLVTWTIATLQLPRPNITEWQPMGLTFANVPFYFTIGLGLAAWGASRQPRRLWEMLTWVLLAVMATQHQRHAPLFGLATVIFLPPHVLALLSRLGPATRDLRAVLARPVVSAALALALLLGGGWCLRSSVAAPRQHPFRVDVPRDVFPVAAIEFMRAHGLTGNTLCFFDWGQQVLWELPDNPVSFDGRLDTVYPAAVMDAHWLLYAGQEPGPAIDLSRAKVALLPTGSPAIGLLLQRHWRIVYGDPLAAVLVNEPAAALKSQLAAAAAVSGRTPFPDAPPVLARRIAR